MAGHCRPSLDDAALEARLFARAPPQATAHAAPDFALDPPGAQARRRHAAAAVGGVPRRATRPAYKYTQFCIKYRAFAPSLKRSMRQVHRRRREAVRRLRRPHRADHRRRHRRDHRAADLRRRAGRVELHLRLTPRATPDSCRLDRRPRARARVLRRRAALIVPDQPAR